MIYIIFDIVYKLSVIGIILSLIAKYLKSNNYHKKTESIILTNDVKKILENELNLTPHKKIKPKRCIINSLRNELLGMTTLQVKKYLNSMNYVLGVHSSNSDQKFIHSGRSVVLCSFEKEIFKDVIDIGDFIYDNKSELPGISIL